jgi:hypothetical protein
MSRIHLVRALMVGALLAFAAPAFADSGPFSLQPQPACIDDNIQVLGVFCRCNVRSVETEYVDDLSRRFRITVDPTIVCAQCDPETTRVFMGGYGAGEHVIRIELLATSIAGPDSGQVTRTDYSLPFVVGSCTSTPLPYLDSVWIGQPSPCLTCPPRVCEGDSISVFLRGTVPSGIVFERVAVVPVLSPFPQPDHIRIFYRETTGGVALSSNWSAQVRIGPLPQNEYPLFIQAFMRHLEFPDSVDHIGSAIHPFIVQQCVDTVGCYRWAFDARPLSPCNDYVGPGREGVTTLGVYASGTVAGLQGRLVFDAPGLRVTGIEPAAQGGLIEWQPASDGASFIVLYPDRQPRPIGQPVVFEPLLRVRVGLQPGASLDSTVRLSPVDLLASDAHGIQVPECPIPPNVRYADPSARFCPELGCDLNGDDQADVRDLVVMVSCLLHLPLGPCPPGALDHLDCNENGTGDFDDVLCCARAILGGAHPDTSGAHPAPEIEVRMGAPVAVAGGVDVPILLTNVVEVGAARLAFTYPDAVFEEAWVEVASHPSNWLALHEASDGRLTFGAIRLGPDELRDTNGGLQLTLHLGTRAGQDPAGIVTFTSGDFSDRAGATLTTSAVAQSVPLAAGLHVQVSNARPNPFAGETRFSVLLTRDSDLEVAVFDLAGRRVATLFRGRAEAGTREFTWRRTRDNGAAVSSGVYFYRAVAGGSSSGRKVLVLSRD